MKITKREWLLAVIIGIGGYILSTDSVLKFFANLSPLMGLIGWYVIVVIFLFILSQIGFSKFQFNSGNIQRFTGILIIMFAFFIISTMGSPYVQQVTMGNLDQQSPIYAQTEDGISWNFWYNTVGIKDIQTSRILSFVITPFILAIIGGLLLVRPAHLHIL